MWFITMTKPRLSKLKGTKAAIFKCQGNGVTTYANNACKAYKFWCKADKECLYRLIWSLELEPLWEGIIKCATVETIN